MFGPFLLFLFLLGTPSFANGLCFFLEKGTRTTHFIGKFEHIMCEKEGFSKRESPMKGLPSPSLFRIVHPWEVIQN